MSPRNGAWLFLSLGWLALTVGCVEGRSSTHELEHVVPTHWPTSLADAANKITDRTAIIEAQSADWQLARTELLEIISWLPEVAAETALPESDWNVIHADCRIIESLMQRPDDLSQALQKLQVLNEKLRELHAQCELASTG